jgi:hypothetical protein
MDSVNKLHRLKEKFHVDKKLLFENYISEINLKELIVSQRNPDELEQTASGGGQVLFLPAKGFHYDKKIPKDQKYKISDLKFYFKTKQNTEELMNQISKEGYIPFDVNMVVTLLNNYPELIEFFNMTTSTYTKSTIHSKEMNVEDNNDKYWLSAYFGNLVEGKTKWRRDRNDLDTSFIIPTYKTKEII